MVSMPRPPFQGGRIPNQMQSNPFAPNFRNPFQMPTRGGFFRGSSGIRGAQQMNQWGAPIRGMQPGNQSGGLLARLLGGGQQGGVARGMQAVNQASGGSFLQSLANPTAINGFLSNTQQVLKTAQSIGPMVQQYGPIVRNLPAMWKLYRGLKDADDDENDKQEDTNTEQNKETNNVNARNKEVNEDKVTNKEHEVSSVELEKPITTKRQTNGESIPKLYI